MTPDERQLLTGLFDRMTGASSQPRDREADAFIAERVRGQPYAPYLLSQTVIVQEQALRAAAEKIQALEAQLQGVQPQEETSFLGNIGKSIFGGGQPAGPQRQPAPPVGGVWGRGSGQPQPAQGGPWGGGGQGYAPQQDYAPQGGPQGGGFLRGALGAAAGVAGGVLAADALRGLFGGHNNPFGIASGGGAGAAGGETIVNNYYGDEAGRGSDDRGGFSQAGRDAGDQQDFLQEQSDDFADGGSDPGGSDDSYNV